MNFSPDEYSFVRLRDFLLANQRPTAMVFDLETNGLYPGDSVLSCTAEKYAIENAGLRKIDFFNRFYFAREEENPAAVRVNGLYRGVIEEKRAGRDWPQYFLDDWDFIGFCGDVRLVVAHNLEFDIRFCPFLSGKERFCTMKSHGFGKYPKLSEIARRYDIEAAADKLHTGEYDTALTAGVFGGILKDLDTYVFVEKSLVFGRPPEAAERVPTYSAAGSDRSEFSLVGDETGPSKEKVRVVRRRLGLA